MNPEQFQKMLEEKGLSLSSRQMEQFDTYFQLLVEWNDKMNLTAITEKNDVYLKHFYDSISASFFFDFQKPLKVCDVGAGAGFPSLPLKICFPEIEVSIVDSLNKRIGFLEFLAKELQLTNVAFYHDRAETFAHNKSHRESYDLVLARAVARMSVLSELCIPLVKESGHFVAMKAVVEEELDKGKKSIQSMGGEIKDIHHFELPVEKSERNIVIIKKIKNTPKKYPRKPGTPNKSPIE